MLAVSDSGPGLDAATQQRIFEPFFNTRAQGQDSGLGMATVYGIVKQHKGNILVYSEPGQGTIFKIYFPLANAPISNTVPEYPAAGSFHGTETVLVVEDEPSVRQLVCNTLRAHGYGVLEAGDSEKALAVAAEHDDPIHLLLTDVTLPRMNGLILYKKLIEEYSGLRVLYISAYTRNVIAHRYGLDDRAAFLQKPFSMYHLLQNMRAVVEKPDY
jgi:CheY-like chemotaxis protein